MHDTFIPRDGRSCMLLAIARASAGSPTTAVGKITFPQRTFRLAVYEIILLKMNVMLNNSPHNISIISYAFNRSGILSFSSAMKYMPSMAINVLIIVLTNSSTRDLKNGRL